MDPIDKAYQEAVERETDKILELSIEDFLKIKDYGSIEVTINGKKNSIGWWHWKFNDDLNHLVFITERKTCLIFYRKYISGVKLENGKLIKLTSEECGTCD